MKDQYGRTIDYLRLSITDRCNLRCTYCMPEGCEWLPMTDILTLEEMETVCRIGAQLGIRKIKVTGGEPLVRKGCTDLIQKLKGIPGIEQVTLTTNGVLLAQYARALKRAGLDGVNVSLDTLNPDTFRRITGADALEQVLRGVDAALEQGLLLKLNAVLQRGINEGEWQSLVELAREKPLDVRFIEMMPIGSGRRFPTISNLLLRAKLEERYGALETDTTIHGNGPAVYVSIPGFMGSAGFISAIHGKFCSSCNRVRLTSTGFLKGCLCYGGGEDLRTPLRRGAFEEVRERFARLIASKPEAHCFEQVNQITEQREMSKIGG